MEKSFDIKKFSEFPIPTMKEWEEVAVKSLKGQPLDRLHKKTNEGITIKPIYTNEDIDDIPFLQDTPGEGSYVRGTKQSGENSSWKINQEIKASSAETFNEMLRNDLTRGQTMINLKIGNDGVQIQTLNDIEVAFSDIAIDKYPLFIQGDMNTLPFFSYLIAFIESKNIEINDVIAFVGNDPLGSLVQTGIIKTKIEKTYDLIEENIKWVEKNKANIRLIHIDSSPYYNAGASAVEELAFAISTGVEYISEFLKRGLSIDDVAKNIYFTFSIGSNVFMEISKLRAARLLWSQIISAFGGSKESQKMYIHGKTSRFTKTKYDPYVNMLRTTTESFAGAVGGVDSMHVSAFDEVLRTPDQFSRRIARNTQVILQEESHLSRVIDPAGGSWYVENLTDQVAKRSWELFQKVEENGGMLSALRSNFVQDLIEKTAAEKQKDVNHRKARVVGTNMYPNLEEKSLLVQEVKEKQLINNKVKVEINPEKCNGTKALSYMIDYAKKGGSIAQILQALESEQAVEIKPLTEFRQAASFEKLRDAAIRYKEKNGKLPQVFFINLGPIPKHKARSDFSTSFFAAGGFEAIKNDGYASSEEAISAVLEENTSIIVINGTDEQYVEHVPTIASTLKNKCRDVTIFVAGKQQEEVEKAFNEAGVDRYIHLKSNCYEILSQLQEDKGVK